MSRIVIDIPDDSLAALQLSDRDAAAELRLAAAMKLYEVGRLSSGAAAALAGIPRPQFLSKLADYNIATFRQSDEELTRELRNA
jgi:predicted HTH domain antitoxin